MKKGTKARQILRKFKAVKFLLIGVFVASYNFKLNSVFLSVTVGITCFAQLLGYLGAINILDQYVPIMPVGVMKIIQITFLILTNNLSSLKNWSILLAIDVMYIIYLLLLKAKYKFEIRE